MVRLVTSSRRPQSSAGKAGGEIRYIARFRNPTLAKMHVHEELRRLLVDIDGGLYRTSLTHAIASIEAVELEHERVWVDPDISEDELEEVELDADHQHAEHHRNDQIWAWVAAVAIALLAVQVLMFS